MLLRETLSIHLNEIKLENPGTLAWAEQMLPRVRALAGNVPITISIGGRGNVPGLVALKEKLSGTEARSDFTRCITTGSQRWPIAPFLRSAHCSLAGAPIHR